MATLLSSTSAGWTSGLCSCSMFHPSVCTPLPRRPQICQKSSLWGGSRTALCHRIASTGDSDSVRASHVITSVLSEPEVWKKSSSTSSDLASLPSEKLNRPSEKWHRPSERFNYMIDTTEEPSSSSSRASWKSVRATRRTTRRRALAICFALATFTQQHGKVSAERKQQVTDSIAQARDFITVSRTTGDATALASSPSRWEGYGDLVTVSTGSSGSSDEQGWVPYRGEDFRVNVPFHWIESYMEIATGSVIRYEDKSDPSTNVIVLKSPTSQSRTNDLGNPEDWIRKQAYLLTGSNEPLQFQAGEEGTNADQKFPRGRVSIAKVLNVDKPKTKQGLTYYTYEIITKQGGRQSDSLHELVSAVVNDGNLYMCRVQTGEERWQQSTQNVAQRIIDSFQITGFKIHA